MANTLLTDLISWWSMNEESGTRDDSHGSNDLADGNTVLYTAGKVGNAADFEATNEEYLWIADNASLSFSGNDDFTFVFWCRLESVAAWSQLITKWDWGSNDREYQMYYDDTKERFVGGVSPNGTASTLVDADTLGVPATETWYFIVFYHDSTNDIISIEVNEGGADTEAHATGIHDDVTEFTVGAQRNNGAAGGAFLDGEIDEVGLWDRVLTDAEMTWLYNSGNGRSYASLTDTFLPTSTTIF